MSDFAVRTIDQLPDLLKAFRKRAGLSQAEAALRLGVTQQTLSALERKPESASLGRLLKLLSILDVELVLRSARSEDVQGTSPGKSRSGRPAW
ncbi:helix-turn-helix domain-containing protein [Schlegelella sp. S2-27]|uniref:Helix-turn-helix domain-containing protein n=1 Tax=Caldimonas mangrovi TaxID=2944811 RepID=A0ABT0YPG4_9BURK|nr:helix-turn-helix transcriptional regulator [Caldimonas mangrovi]MCM5680633.1 helix-turn-helix domain-containing protein [Caldimonas mangrovi]